MIDFVSGDAGLWHTTTDRLFLWFSLAVWLVAVDDAVLGRWPLGNEWRLPVFAVRLRLF